jgi:hypothetical protein
MVVDRSLRVSRALMRGCPQPRVAARKGVGVSMRRAMLATIALLPVLSIGCAVSQSAVPVAAAMAPHDANARPDRAAIAPRDRMRIVRRLMRSAASAARFRRRAPRREVAS